MRVDKSAGDQAAALESAIALYLGNFDLMVEARTVAARRRTNESFDAVQDAVAADAPWARAELLEVLVAHAQVRQALACAVADLRRLQEGHTRAVETLRAAVGYSVSPWG